ncbi:hypothetical protein HDV00_008327 [Rhizophlyctis rosea]|nr:hypothetical protein HDV00_008327 [Rhizophlyctis rosea]
MAPQFITYADTLNNPTVTLSTGESGKENAYALFCPNPDCRCIIIKGGVGVKTATDLSIDLPPYIASPTSPSASASGALHPPYYWKLTDMMQFENIGFTKPVDSLSASSTSSSLPSTASLVDHTNNQNGAPAKQFRYLSCADCDVGPLGYHVGPPTSYNATAGGGIGAVEKEYLIAADRVRYRIEA